MRKTFLAALALCLVITATGANALRPTDPIFDPTDPIIDPTDPCLENPILCEPVDPCVLNPSLCEPPPPPPQCELVEVLCPGEEEPPVAPPEPSFSHVLSGVAKVKGSDFKTSEPYTLQISFDTTALTFLAMDGANNLYSGLLVPKGTKGVKFQIFLDDASGDAFSADVAARGATASGRSAGAIVGESGKLTLKTFEDGSASLKIKTSVLATGLGEVVFKANLTEVPR